MARRAFRPDELPEQLVENPAALAECVEHLRSAKLLGFDTEFVGEETYRPELCLIQVSTAARLVVIDPHTSGPLDEFWKLLHDPKRTVIVHAGREEVRMCQHFSGQSPAALFDAQIAAGLVGMNYPISYAGLIQETLGIRLSKSDTLTDWRRRPLSDSQIRYAYDDVRYLIPAYEKLHRRLKKLERIDWAEEEFATFLKWALGDDPTVERWRKFKGIGTLTRRELAILREVYAWRDRSAERQDRPVRSVMRDDVLLEAVKAGARSPEDFLRLRGLPRHEMPALVDAVRRGRTCSPTNYPELATTVHEPPQMATLTALLNVVLGELCEQLKLSMPLVCSQHHIKDVIRSYSPKGQLPATSPFAKGWRQTAILPQLQRVLDGKLAIRVCDPNRGTPLELTPIED